MANGALIGALRVTLGLDSASFEAGARRAETTASGMRVKMEGSFKAIGSAVGALKSALAGAAVGFVVSGLKEAVTAGLDYASSLGEVAQQLGVTTQTLQVYRYAATQVGIEQEAMDKGLAKLTMTLGQAGAGGKKQTAAFQALGVSVHDANGNLRSTDDILPDIIRALSAIESPAQRAALEVSIFGKAGQQLDTLLAGGVDQVDQLKNAAQRLGIVLSDEQIANADQTADKLAELQLVLKANIAGAVANNASAIYDLANSLMELAGKAARAWQQLSNFENFQIVDKPILAKLSHAQGGKDEDAARRALMGNQAGRQQLYSRALAKGRALPRNDPMRQVYWGEADSIIAAERAARAGQVRPKPKPKPDLDPDDGSKPRKRNRSGGGGGGARSGPSLADEAKRALDSLFPDDARRRELEERMATLGKALAAKVVPLAEYERAKGEITRQLAAIAPEAQRIVDAMMPEAAKVREVQGQLEEVNRGMAAGLVDPATWAAVRQKLIAELFDAQTAAKAALDKRNAGGGDAIQTPDLAPISALPGAVDEAAKAVTTRWDGLKVANDNLKQSFAETAEGVTRSLSGLVNSIRGGDWMSALEGVVGLFTQLGSAGAFGSKIKTNINSKGVPGFATGGSFRVGGRGGVDTNLVSMRLTRGEMVDIRRPGQSGSGGRPVIFDARGAVMTSDLLAQMGQIATETGGALISRDNDSVAFANSLRLGGRR